MKTLIYSAATTALLTVIVNDGVGMLKEPSLPLLILVSGIAVGIGGSLLSFGPRPGHALGFLDWFGLILAGFYHPEGPSSERRLRKVVQHIQSISINKVVEAERPLLHGTRGR
jgi:hypothetical protein